MKKIFSSILLVVALMSCHSSGQNIVNVVPSQSYSQNVPSNIQVQTNNIPGFNVQSFANLVRTTSNPQVLEQQINDPNSGINTLDLDNDGNVDYLKVVESANQLVVIDETCSSNCNTTHWCLGIHYLCRKSHRNFSRDSNNVAISHIINTLIWVIFNTLIPP